MISRRGGRMSLLGRSRASRFVRFRLLGCQRRGGIFLSCLAASDEADRWVSCLCISDDPISRAYNWTRIQ